MNSTLPFMTIVMPVHNEGRFIADTLGYILRQDYPRSLFEIIVADGGSTDSTREIVKEVARVHPQVILINNPGLLPSSGRNIGFNNGKGDIFIVIDGHCYIDNDQLLRNIVDCFERSGAQCLGRSQPLNPPGLSTFQKAVSLARSSRLGHSGGSYIYSSFEGYVSPVSHGAIYKREIFEKIGKVDESFDACEDVEFNYRVENAGFKTFMSSSLMIRYYPREDCRGLFKQMKRYGKGRFKFTMKHPEAFNLEMLIPPIFVIGLISFPLLYILLSLFHSLSLFLIFDLWLIGYGFYILLILTESARISIRDGFKYFNYLFSIFFIIHFGLGWGFVSSLIRRFLSWLPFEGRVFHETV